MPDNDTLQFPHWRTSSVCCFYYITGDNVFHSGCQIGAQHFHFVFIVFLQYMAWGLSYESICTLCVTRNALCVMRFLRIHMYVYAERVKLRSHAYGIWRKSLHILINESVHMYTGTAYGYGIRIGYGYFDRSMSRFLPSRIPSRIGNSRKWRQKCPCYRETHPSIQPSIH